MPESREQGHDIHQEFLKNGGRILESFSDGTSKRWVCGKNEKGGKVDPEDVDVKEIIHYLNKDGRWEGMVPTEEDLKEQEVWDVES